MKWGIIRAGLVLALLLAGEAHACPGRAADRFPQSVPVGTLIGRIVQQPVESQAVLGTVRAIGRRPDGCLVAIMDYGGLLARFGGVWGLGSRPVAVPLGAMTLLGRAMQVVDLSPAELDALPSEAGGVETLAAGVMVSVGLSGPAH